MSFNKKAPTESAGAWEVPHGELNLVYL